MSGYVCYPIVNWKGSGYLHRLPSAPSIVPQAIANQ